MPKTFTFAVSQAPALTPVIIRTNTRRVEIREDSGVASYPTGNFLMYSPSASDLPVTFITGSSYEVDIEARSGYYVPGQILCYVSAVTASTTFAQIEDGIN